MKNLFFVLISFAFFITSCTKEFVEPVNSFETIQNTVSNRTGTTELTLTVSNIQIIGDDVIIEFVNFDDENSELTITENQTFTFNDNLTGNTPVSVSMTVVGFEIIGDDVIIESVAPGINFDTLTIADEQTVAFNIE